MQFKRLFLSRVLFADKTIKHEGCNGLQISLHRGVSGNSFYRR